MASEALSARETEVYVEATGGKLSPGPGRLRKEVAAHQLTRIHRALIDVVAERGYKALRVRDVVRRAEVSTRAFYELFDSKDDCFLCSYDRLTRRATRRMVVSQAGESDWARRAEAIFGEFARQIARDPKAAHLVLVDVHRADAACADRAWRAERAFEMVFGECLSRAPGGVSLPQTIIEAIAAGVTGVARGYLSSRRADALRDASDDLVGWALRYADSSAVELAALDGGSIWRDTLLESPYLMSGQSEGRRGRVGSGGHALILQRTAELAMKNGYSALTVERIRAEANVSRREFRTYFDDVAACYVAAFEQRAGEAMAQAARAQAAARTWGGGIYRAIAAYWAQVGNDPFLAQAFMTNDFPAGTTGARSRRRVIKAMADQLLDTIPHDHRPARLELEASMYAASALFRRHLSSSGSSRRNLSATLAYLLLAPAIGSRAALAEIANEQ